MATKHMIALAFISLTTLVCGQSDITKNNKVLLTKKYAGLYSFGNSIERGAVGSVIIYPETDTTVLFFIDICRGVPSYNLGQLYSRLQIKNGEAFYSSKEDYAKTGCRWKIIINKEELIIKTIDNYYECGFGGNVIADNQYKRKDNRIPKYFTDGEGHKIFFAKTSPEHYLK